MRVEVKKQLVQNVIHVLKMPDTATEKLSGISVYAAIQYVLHLPPLHNIGKLLHCVAFRAAGYRKPWYS